LSILARARRTWEAQPLPPLTVPGPSWRGVLSLLTTTALLALFVSAAIVLWTDVLKTYEQRSSFEPREGRGDFIAFYVAGEFVAEGRGDKIYDLEEISSRENELMPPTPSESRELPFYNPTFVAGVFVLISLLAYQQALWAWLVVNVVVLAACIALLDRLLTREPLQLRLPFALGAISFIPVYRAVGLGQASLFVLLFSTLAFGWLAEARQGRAGVMLGLLLIKPQYAVLPVLQLIIARKRQALLSFAAVAVVATAASVAVAGPQVVVDYPRLLIESGSWRESRGIYPANWFSWTGFFYALSWPSTAATFLGVALGLIGAVAALAISARVPHRGPTVLTGGAALTVAVLLLSPHVYRQDLVLLLFPAAVLLALTRGAARLAVCGFLLAIWIVVWTPVIVPAIPEPPWQGLSAENLGFNLFVPLMAAFLVALLTLLWIHRDESSESPADNPF